MANIKKFTKSTVSGLLKHLDRSQSNNKQIDSSRTHLNYNLLEDRTESQAEIMSQRLDKVKVQNRADVNLLCDWCVTLPKDFTGDSKEFFQETYNFLENLYGKKNVVSAYVHMDETSPHMHFAFIPVVFDKKKQIEKVSAKALITRSHLMKFHPRLESALKAHFGHSVGILNGSTGGRNKSISRLKLETAQANFERAVEKASSSAVEILGDISEIKKSQKMKMGFLDNVRKTVIGLCAKVDRLEKKLNSWRRKSPEQLENLAKKLRKNNCPNYEDLQKKNKANNYEIDY